MFSLKIKQAACCVCLAVSLASCTKFLDKKPNQKLATPSSLSELQTLLDNTYVMNLTPGSIKTPADEYYILSSSYDALPIEFDKSVYLWQPTTLLDNDWNNGYKLIFYANTVLDNISSVKASDIKEWNKIKGSALFYRAWGFYQLAQVFCPAYDAATAAKDAGIPLRLNADFEEKSVRSTVKQSYEQMLADLQAAIELLPAAPDYASRPSKPAAYGLLGRIWMAMGDYQKGMEATEAALSLYNVLVDFNTINAGAAVPFPSLCKEVIFYSYNFSSSPLTSARGRIDSTLVLSYAANDLRAKVFCKDNSNGSFAFKGSYDGATSSQTFTGVATDELYLNKAECACRLKQPAIAMQALNTLLVNRRKTGTHVPLDIKDVKQALDTVLMERKRELPFRGTRWPDIRRMNIQGANIVLERIINGVRYTLPANDKRATFLIPQRVIDLSGMEQNN